MNKRFEIDRSGKVIDTLEGQPEPTYVSFRPGISQGGDEAYKRRIDYDPENVRNWFIKTEKEFLRKELEAQKAIDDYKADISRKQEKLQSSINALKVNLKSIDSEVEKAEAAFAAATVAGNIEEAQEKQSRLESLQKGKEKTLRELSAFTNALDRVEGDERLYKRILAKYEACVQMREEFKRQSNSLIRLADEQKAIWESFSYHVIRGHIALGIHVGGYNEIVKKHGA